MRKNFWQIVNDVIRRADVVLLVLDARQIDETRNPEVEKKVARSKKPIVYVVSKCDLVEKSTLDNLKLKPSVFISATKHLGTTKLRERILIEAKRAYGERSQYVVGVLGYPNVGKSSLINAMAGRRAAPASHVSGQTKSLRAVKGDNRLKFLDTPGVLPYKEVDESKHALIGAIDFNKVKEPDLVVMDLMEKHPGLIEEFYGVDVLDDFEETIEAIAVSRNHLKRGGVPDIDRTSRMILKDWQTGKIANK